MMHKTCINILVLALTTLKGWFYLISYVHVNTNELSCQRVCHNIITILYYIILLGVQAIVFNSNSFFLGTNIHNKLSVTLQADQSHWSTFRSKTDNLDSLNLPRKRRTVVTARLKGGQLPLFAVAEVEMCNITNQMASIIIILELYAVMKHSGDGVTYYTLQSQWCNCLLEK